MLPVNSRLIDTWFPCPEVDKAVRTPAGSGRSEKALFTWFASRTIAQARAAVLCSLLTDTPDIRKDVKLAVLGDKPAIERLQKQVAEQYRGRPPVVLDMFSGRGIIPLEAARAGATAIGTDLSPVATLASRLLADYALRDWSPEPVLPFTEGLSATSDDDEDAELAEDSAQMTLGEFDNGPRLLGDVGKVLAQVEARVAARTARYYASSSATAGPTPWAYLWAVTIPCDGCGRRFPLLGSMVLRHPYSRTKDAGQAMRLETKGDAFLVKIHDGAAQQEPTYSAPAGTRGKSARCPFATCGRVHSLDVVKAKGVAGQYEDAMLAVGDIESGSNRKVFRQPRADERDALNQVPDDLAVMISDGRVPTEPIPVTAGVDARQYGYLTYGSLANARQTLLLTTTVDVIAEIGAELLANGNSPDYTNALMGFAAANLTRQLRYSTRGAFLRAHGNPEGTSQNRCQVADIFSAQSVIRFQFDYIEAGPGAGPGTWSSVASSLLNALRKVLAETHIASGHPGRFSRVSAVNLPYRDGSVDAVVTDPPYYAMIAYADSSDLFFVWLKRALQEFAPDLYGTQDVEGSDGLQDKSDEIIVKGRGAKGKGDHRTEEFYEHMLARSFGEARRVLKDDGHLTVIFGHSDPDAWKRLLTALTAAGFVVTASWPSRTETANTGVATISVTVSIGARVAPAGRPVGIAAQVDAEVLADVKDRCRGWDVDGLALEDQLMAAYGAALSVVGGYERVITPTGETVPLEHYMTLARRAVRDAIALRLDELPLETFDPYTRFAVFWQELYGTADVPKGEARFFAQSDDLRLEDLRGPILTETKAGFRLRHDAPERIVAGASVFEVVRGMAAAWHSGSDAVGGVITQADLEPANPHLWAVVDWVAAKLPASSPVRVSLDAIKRNKGTIQAVAATAPADTLEQLTLDGDDR